MRPWPDYEKALAQVKRAIEDLTDDQIDILRERRPDFAEQVAEHRARKRAGAEYQKRVAAATADEDYARDVRRRQLADSLRQREACWNGSEPRRVLPRKTGVVRIMSREEIERQKDLTRGVVRITPRGRR